jgi:hypothetical protein
MHPKPQLHKMIDRMLFLRELEWYHYRVSLSVCVCVCVRPLATRHMEHQLNSRVDTHVVCCVVRLYIFLLAFSDTKYTNLSAYKTT